MKWYIYFADGTRELVEADRQGLTKNGDAYFEVGSEFDEEEEDSMPIAYEVVCYFASGHWVKIEKVKEY